MSTLAEIEAAADSLCSEDKEALLRFLAMRLAAGRTALRPNRASTPTAKWPPCSPRTRPMERDSGKKLRIFLDSSVALAASLSATGASHEVFGLAGHQDWILLVSPWVLRGGAAQPRRQAAAGRAPGWVVLRSLLAVEDDELTFDWPVAFEKSKDKPCIVQRACLRRCAVDARPARLWRTARQNDLWLARADARRVFAGRARSGTVAAYF